MDTQLTLFDQPTAPQINTVPPTSCKIIQFPGTSAVEPPKKVNYRKGEEQTVFPIKSREQLDAMASWLRANADPKYLLAFILGINLGLRANELLELKCSDIFFPDGKIRYIVGDYTDTTDKISVFQEKVDKRRGLYLNESCVHAIQWYYRVERLIERAVERIRLNKCQRLHVVLLGDAAHGSIHTSARVASEELTCDQIMQVSEIMAQAISVLADEVEQTVVHATYGNHLRTVQNKNDSIHADNMERLIPWWLEQRLHDRGDIVFPESEYYEFLYFSVCGYNICAAHGDLDNVKNAGKTLHTLFAKKYSSDIDYVVLADKHHKEEFEELGIESMIAPCLCGTDDYANGKRLYSTPAQLMMVFRPGVGADACYQIKLN